MEAEPKVDQPLVVYCRAGRSREREDEDGIWLWHTRRS